MPAIKLIECPRDAMQGWPVFIPTEMKAAYLQQLLAIGFDTLDFGSFVSAQAIPQMADTEEVLNRLDLSGTKTKLLAIVANLRGAEKAADRPEIKYLGFPLSLSETFQQRNTRKSIAEALREVNRIQDLCARRNQELVLYLSMGFGNPYGDPWSPEAVLDLVQQLASGPVRIISLADTIGLARPEDISYLFQTLIRTFPQIGFGAHLHTRPNNWQPQIAAAYEAGCRRFDGALKGFGGCPMARDELVGNLATENLITFFENIGLPLELNKRALDPALALAQVIFTP